MIIRIAILEGLAGEAKMYVQYNEGSKRSDIGNRIGV